MKSTPDIESLVIPLEQDLFLRTLIRELAGILEGVIGSREAAGYISLVGQQIGDWINSMYGKSLATSSFKREDVADILVDLKKRIQGDFYIIDQNDDRIILGNHACPFGDKVLDRPSMCMMTSNVFGVIAAENLGYAKVVLEETIAGHDPGCRVVIHIKPTREAENTVGREYFRTR